MKKKKLVIFLLVAIMVLTLAVTALVGCKPEEDPAEKPIVEPAPDGYKTMTTSLSSALQDALWNTSEDQLVNNIQASAQLKVSTKYGDSTNEYLIKFGANVALNTDDKNTTTFGLSIVDSKANANILNAYYVEIPATKEEDKLGSGDVYVDLGSGANAKHFALKGLSIKTVLANHKATVSDKQAEQINSDVNTAIGSVFGYLDMASALGNVYQSNDNSTILFRLDLKYILETADDILAALNVIDQYTEQLGLSLKAANLKDILPALTVDLSFKFEDAEADSFSDAKLVGVDAKLGVPAKDIRITRSDEEKTDFVRINIAKDCELGLGLGFKFGDDADEIPEPLANSSEYTAKRIGAINFTAEGELQLNQAIGVEVAAIDSTIAIPKGNYKINLAVSLNPVNLIGLSFNPKGVSGVLDLIKDIFNNKVIEYLAVEIVDKDDPTNEEKQLKLYIKEDLDKQIKVFVTQSQLLGSDISSVLKILKGGMNIAGLLELDFVKNLLPKDEEVTTPGSGDSSSNESGNGSGETASGDNNKFDLTPIADLIKNFTLIINDGKITADVQNHTVNKNLKYKTETKFYDDGTSGEVVVYDENNKPVVDKDYGDTTINVTAEASKNGLKLDASILNIILNQTEERKADISARIEANSNGITITAKSAAKLDKDAAEIDFGSGIKMTIDLVLKLTKVEYGNAPSIK